MALRYLMNYLDNSVDSLNDKKELLDFMRFLVNKRYKVHDILDDFISAQVKVRRALNNGTQLPFLSESTTTIEKSTPF